jgi:integrase
MTGEIANRDGFDQELLARLVEQARVDLAEARPENTRATYQRQWSQFTAWCDRVGQTPFPTSAETLVLYVTYLRRAEGKAPSSIETALGVILAAHPKQAKPDTTAARDLVRAYKRERAAEGRTKRRAKALDVRTLRETVTACPNTTKGLRDRVLLVLGFALFARRSELAHLLIEDIEEVDAGLYVTIRTSKADKESKGERIDLSYGSDPDTCPVRTVRAWLAHLAERGITSGPLIRSVDRHGNLGDRMTGEGVNYVVQRLVPQQGISAHSLRAGGATAADAAGANEASIKKRGRWKSTVYQDYIRSADFRNDPMKGVL